MILYYNKYDNTEKHVNIKRTYRAEEKKNSGRKVSYSSLLWIDPDGIIL